MQEVLAFERVGIARYARCERLLQAAPDALGEALGRACRRRLRERWMRMLVQARRARLLAYRVVSLQAAGRVRPQDAAAYRIAVTRLDQDSAAVLTEIAGYAPASPEGERFRAETADHASYSVAATISSGSSDMQRILLSRALLARPMNIDFVRGGARPSARPHCSAFGNAGGDDLLQAAERDPASRASRIEPVLASLGAWELQPRASADELEAAAALCRSAGWWAVAVPDRRAAGPPGRSRGGRSARRR